MLDCVGGRKSSVETFVLGKGTFANVVMKKSPHFLIINNVAQIVLVIKPFFKGPVFKEKSYQGVKNVMEYALKDLDGVFFLVQILQHAVKNINKFTCVMD